MLKKQGWKTALGGSNSEVKQKIFGQNSARLYNLDMKTAKSQAFDADQLSAIRQKYMRLGGEGSNTYYGYIAKKALA